MVSPLFTYNEKKHVWYICESTAPAGTEGYNDYWLGIYDEDAPNHAGNLLIYMHGFGGSCVYCIETFFNQKDIDSEGALRAQELLLHKLNELIRDGVLTEE